MQPSSRLYDSHELVMCAVDIADRSLLDCFEGSGIVFFISELLRSEALSIKTFILDNLYTNLSIYCQERWENVTNQDSN